MKMLGRFLFALTLAVVLSGCASMQPRETMLLQQSRYDELEDYMETRIVDPAAVSFSELFYLCYAHSKVGRYDRLFPCLDQLQAKVDKGDFRLYYFDFRATPALLRSVAWMELGNRAKAVEEAEKGYALAKTYKTYLQMWIYALSAVGLAHALADQPDQAGTYAAELEAVSTGYPHTLLAKDKYIGLARIYMALGDYPRALEAVRHVEDSRFLESFADLVSGAALTGQSLFTYWELPKQYILNRCLLETGDIGGARTGYDRLLELPQTEQNGDIYWIILFDLGRIAERENQPQQAVEFYRRAVEIVETQRATITSEASKIGFAGNKQELYHRMISALFSLGRHREAFEYAERSKARALVDMLAARRDLAVPSRNAEYVRQTLERLEQAEKAYRVESHRVSTERYRQQRGIALQLRKELAETAPDLASLVTVTAFGAEEIRALLPADETLVEYYCSGDDLFAFVLTRDGLRGRKLPGKGLAGDVFRFRETISNPSSSGYREVSRTLYDRLIEPLKGMLDCRNLLIVPHGALHYLPFCALFSGTEYLIDRHDIRMLPSSSVLKFLKDHRQRKDTLIALGNPDLGDPGLGLRFAQEEAWDIARERPEATLLLRGQATETAVKEHGSDFKYLHFATHGKFFPEDPLRSGLLLARDQSNDGMLTVAELYTLRLGADLVTLSACETALGRVESGDDVVGFTRGFLYAGASSIVSSLWSVDDRATCELMKQFYKDLDGMGKREALLRAQRTVRQSYPHPFYWAAFQITGLAW